MQITLFRALQSIKVGDDQATAVVERLESHVESVVNNNVKAVEAKLAGMQAMLEAMRMQINFVGAMLGIIGLAIAVGPIIAKLIR